MRRGKYTREGGVQISRERSVVVVSITSYSSLVLSGADQESSYPRVTGLFLDLQKLDVEDES